MEIAARWSDEDIGRIVEAARASRHRAEIMREHCQKMQAKLRLQQRRIAALPARLALPTGVEPAPRTPGSDAAPRPEHR